MHTLPLSLLFLSLPALAQDPRPLEVADGDAWRSLTETQLSESGAWAAYGLAVADGSDGSLEVVSTRGETRHVIERGSGARFDVGERILAARVSPGKDALKAYKAKKKEDPKNAGEEPKTALVIVDLASGARSEIPRVNSFAMPSEAGGWLAVHLLAPPKGDEDKEKQAEEPRPEEEEQQKPEEEQPDAEPEKKKKERTPGTDLILRDLSDGSERSFANVTSFAFAPDARALVYVVTTKAGQGDGIYMLALTRDANPQAVLATEAEVTSLTFSEQGDQLAFLVGLERLADEAEEREDDDPKSWSLHHASVPGGKATKVADTGSAGIPAGWGVSKDRGPRFSEDGLRLTFGTAPLPDPKPEEIEDEDKVTLDVWSWTDDRIQPLQLVQLAQDKSRSYLALLTPGRGDGRVVQLATPEVPDVRLSETGAGAWALGSSDLPYRAQQQWDSDVPRDVYRVELATGKLELLVRGALGRPALSPNGRWATWWDGRARQLMGVELAAGGEARALTQDVPHPLWNELHDSPSLPRSYGTGGWLSGDVGLFVYDAHDLWLVDPTGAAPVVCVTEGLGRRTGWRFRRIDLTPDEPHISPLESLLLSGFHLTEKRAGFYRDRLIGAGEPEELLVDAKHYGTPVKARGGDVLRFTREDFVEYPNVWVSNLDFQDARQLSDANPQQAQYLWGNARLHEWRSADGTPLQGILYTPDNFDATQGHPLIVYFYERSSDGLYRHNSPVPSRSSVRFPYYTSNGYCVFVPDIPYRVGYPGPSCCDAVIPGVLSLIEEGFIDEEAIGLQGHSWGGYQIAYMVTQSRLFAAAVSGAPVSNMTSAYGGIRWQSGMSRQFQYEKTQSRLGGSLWEVPNRYFENSPIFFADKVETPVLMLHNDKDGAVPWYQGIEYFVALKRLNKPVWLLNYNGEGHGIGKYSHKRDYATRMSQFFDFYLRGAPAPEWMVHGVPALQKGMDLGLELVGQAEGE